MPRKREPPKPLYGFGNRASRPFIEFNTAPRGSVERFLGGVMDPVATGLLASALGSGLQLSSSLLPAQLTAAVIILACYARRELEVELVDNYEALLDRWPEDVGHCSHSDMFFASCIVQLHHRGEYPSTEAFQDLNLPFIFDQLVKFDD